MKIYTGNQATGYTTASNGISQTTYNEQTARFNGTIKNDVPTWALCCGWTKTR
jgi:hypothetical protein